jgi:hypothetical protein
VRGPPPLRFTGILWRLLAALTAGYLMLRLIDWLTPINRGGAPPPGGSACLVPANYVGWNYAREGIGLRHHLVVRFPVQIMAVPFQYRVYFHGREVALGDPAVVDLHTIHRLTNTPVANLLFPLRTRWLVRVEIYDAQHWELLVPCTDVNVRL